MSYSDSQVQTRLANLAARLRSRRNDSIVPESDRVVGLEMDMQRLIETLQRALPGSIPDLDAVASPSPDQQAAGTVPLSAEDLERARDWVRNDIGAASLSGSLEWMGALLDHIEWMQAQR